ncbi:MAG: hypothetical protein QNJ72_40385 [Pleurocapsa sp. MO_226.B13]|nr:hypothetical protein [Pleurocapsa sp. MO_226.B13]
MRSNHSVVINLGRGSLSYGFTNVIAQIIDADNSIAAQFTASLPRSLKVADCYQMWQSIYLALSQRLVMLSPTESEEDDDDELEIDSFGVTQVSQLSFESACSNLADEFNSWLQHSEFLQLEQNMLRLPR